MSEGATSSYALLVDDEPEYLEWVIEYLESQKLNVETARTLAEALAALEAKSFRLILIDMNIPATGAAASLASSAIQRQYPGIISRSESSHEGLWGT
jgi:DNA-binding response OmpR family regulator